MFRRRHQAAVPVRDPNFVLNDVPSAAPTCSPSSAPTLAPSGAPSSDPPNCNPSAGPTAGQSDGPGLVPRAFSSAAPTCSLSSAPSLAPSSARFSFSTATTSCSPSAGPTAGPFYGPSLVLNDVPWRPRLVLRRPALRPWCHPVLLPVIPRQHQAAIPAQDRPRDSPMARAWFRGLFPRRLRLVLCPVLRP